MTAQFGRRRLFFSTGRPVFSTGRKGTGPLALLALTACLALLVTASIHAGEQDPAAEITRLLGHTNLRDAVVSVEIRSVGTGRTLFSLNAHEPLIVASNNKLVSTASALFHCGEDYSFETRLFSRGAVTKGRLAGDLIVKGGGDPCLCRRFFDKGPGEPVRNLVAGVKNAGIRVVSGDLVIDDTLFDREYTAPGWPTDQLSYYYCAPVSGLSLNENVLDVTVASASLPGAAARVTLSPRGGRYSVRGTIKTGGRKGKNAIHILRPDRQGVVAVRGETPLSGVPWKGRVSVDEPPLFFAAVFREMLRAEGIVLQGRIVLAEKPIRCTGTGCRQLAILRSPLREALIITNKESHNNFAEHLFKLAGSKVKGRGTFSSGSDAVHALFAGLGIDDADPFTIVDGSGLSRENRFSSHTIVSLLAGMYASPLRNLYVRSLPISGEDGSLKKRMTEKSSRRKVRAKTGWIRTVSALSGYIQAVNGEVFAFSILFNRYKGMNADMKKVQDNICRVVVNRK
jgi:serine-type D-Ala-D-Ala carboxypeptidase/endopeptidase (penicillin-binding protein 4)